MQRVITFFDTQNLYHSVKSIWPEYHWPNFCPVKLSNLVTGLSPDRSLKQIRLYTGIPNPRENPRWHSFWTNKTRALKLLRPDCFIFKGIVNRFGKEKGVDVKLAIDVIRLTFEEEFDTAIIFSQDKDLIESIKMAHDISSKLKSNITFECAYPCDIDSGNKRGLIRTTWRKIDREMYEKCIDQNDYR